MTNMRFALAVALVCLLSTYGSAQINVNGQLYSDLYAFENASEEQQLDYYQGLVLRVRQQQSSNVLFKTNLRVARRGASPEWAERLYNAYLDWRATGGVVAARAGRQFLYQGVINGSLDGLSLRLKPSDAVDLRVVGGVATPYDRSMDVRSWDEGGVFGAYGAARLASEARLEASYVQRQSNGEVGWHQVGAGLTGTLGGALYYLARFDYNIEAETTQAMRYRATYAPDGWSVFGEYSKQRPRIFEDSYFQIFELVGFQQLRAGGSYAIGNYRLGLQGFRTIYEDSDSEATDELLVSFGNNWGAIGAVYQTGYGGENVSLYADIRYPVTESLTVRLYSAHYSYERRSIALTEEATAFSGGVEFSPIQSLTIRAEIQESLNSYYSNDLRGLVRLTYGFRAG